jgi:hypothetical protein
MMSDDLERSEKHDLARQSLPDELVPVFDDLVADYRFLAMKHHGSRFVSFAVLADRVRAGWRLVTKPKDGSESNESPGSGRV